MQQQKIIIKQAVRLDIEVLKHIYELGSIHTFNKIY